DERNLLPRREFQLYECASLREREAASGLNEQGARVLRPEGDSICCCDCFMSVSRIAEGGYALESHCYLAPCHRYTSDNNALIETAAKGHEISDLCDSIGS